MGDWRYGLRCMKTVLALATMLMVTPVGGAQEPAKAPLKAVAGMDLNRYMGTWYEVARLPFKYQDRCVGDVTATYAVQPDGRVLVVNRCRTSDGSVSVAQGVVRKADANGPDTKLRVRFAPSWLSLLPFVWGDYWVIELAPDYSYAAVGEPGRKNLWILSRTPSMEEAQLQRVLEKVRENGYDLAPLIRTQNSAR
jgi:apolipoprotein D and lipocalin family protein